MSEASISVTDQVVSVSGDMTLGTVRRLRAQGARSIAELIDPLIDFSNVSRCDSSALVLLLAWLRDAKYAGKVLKFQHLPKQLLALAEVCGINVLFNQ